MRIKIEAEELSMNKFLCITAVCGILALGKYLLHGNRVEDGKLIQWLATAGIISSFATLLSIIYIFARKLALNQVRKKRPDFIEILKIREKAMGRNSMLPLLTKPVITDDLPAIGIVEINSGELPNGSLSEG